MNAREAVGGEECSLSPPSPGKKPPVDSVADLPGLSATVSNFYESSGTQTGFSFIPNQTSYCRRSRRRHLTAQLNSNGLVSIEQLTFGKPIII